MRICRPCFEAWKIIPGLAPETTQEDPNQDMSTHNCQQPICECLCKEDYMSEIFCIRCKEDFPVRTLDVKGPVIGLLFPSYEIPEKIKLRDFHPSPEQVRVYLCGNCWFDKLHEIEAELGGE